MSYQSFCSVCKRPITALGFSCLCVAPVAYHVQPTEAELSPTVVAAPHFSHGQESEIERQLAMRPVAGITTSSNTTIRPLTGVMQFSYEQPQAFVRGPLGTLVTSLTSYPPKV